MKRKIAGLLIAAASFVFAAHAQLTFTGITMYGATNSSGAWNGWYDYWDTVGGNFGFNVYLFTGSTNSPVFLNNGDSSATLNPNLALSPGTYVIQYACDFHGWDPSTPYLGVNFYFNNDFTDNRISAVVPNNGSDNFAVIGNATMTYGEGNATLGSGSLSYTSGNVTVTLSDFNTSASMPNLVSGYNNTPGSESDFVGSFTLTVTPARPNLSIWTAVELGWNSSTNYLYQVQWSTNLISSNWFNLGAPIQGNGTTNYLFDTTRTSPKKYYRVIFAQ